MAAKKQGSAAKKQGSAASKKSASVARKTTLPEQEEAALQGHEEVRGEDQGESEDHLVGVDEQQEMDDDHEEGEDDDEEGEEATGEGAEETLADVTVSTSKGSSSGAAKMSKVMQNQG